MNIIQSFFNKRITPQNLNYRGGYLSSFVFWLSIAYSCLLLKRNNPTLRLLFYGNETIVHILKDLFKLPYDKYYICDYNGDYNEWFYCWPKILTYQRQKEPFIHIDSDIFMWTPIPEALLKAPLVAQHKERDSNFYREVFNEIKKDNIQLPQYIMQHCIGDKYISSFNAGIIGGNDLLFLQRYINNIINFVSKNKGNLDKASRKFLYNVVFEQWLYYGMTTFEHKEVCTIPEHNISPLINFPELGIFLEKSKSMQQLAKENNNESKVHEISTAYDEINIKLSKDILEIFQEQSKCRDLLWSNISLLEKKVMINPKCKIISISHEDIIRNVLHLDDNILRKVTNIKDLAVVITPDATLGQPQKLLLAGVKMQIIWYLQNVKNATFKEIKNCLEVKQQGEGISKKLYEKDVDKVFRSLVYSNILVFS